MARRPRVDAVIDLELLDDCDCPCHQVIQPGLIPCPQCDPEPDHSSRTIRTTPR